MSERAEESVRGWLANRMIECLDQYLEQHDKELRSIKSITELGYRLTHHQHFFTNSPAGFWLEYFLSYFTKSQDKHLKSRVLSMFGVDCINKKFFDRVFDEHIQQECALLDQMKEAVGFTLATYKAFFLLNDPPKSLEDLVYANLACKTVAYVGQDRIRMLTLQVYNCK